MDLKTELDFICKQLKANIEYFGDKFPGPCAREGRYPKIENVEWTNGFWTGMLWIAYEYSNDPIFRTVAEKNNESFRKRIDEVDNINHHDLGFLFVPSLVASYKITGNELDREYALKAAQMLKGRYHQNGQFIQAWWDLDDDNEYRFIVDSLMNIPLLHWAYEQTGDEEYDVIAKNHVKTVSEYGIRDDYTTHHMYYFNREDGSPVGGKTAQGVNDDSCWARGQAWVVCGLIFNNHYIQNPKYDELALNVYNYYRERVQSDLMPYWDLAFEKDSNQYHDSSAAAIVCCGLHDYILKNENSQLSSDLTAMIESMLKDYASSNYVRTQGLLEHGLYAHRFCNGIDEPNQWGDYFYLEAIYRMYKGQDWRGYW